MLVRVKEQSSAVLGLTFRDHLGALKTPVTIQYRIDCVDNKQQIRDWTDIVSPASEVSVNITPDDNSIIFVSRGVEKHMITVKATYDGGGEAAAEYVYEIQNLRFLNS